MPYRTVRPRAGYYDEEVGQILMPESSVVHEREDTWTGLYDRHGDEIWRVRDPIGFRLTAKGE